LVGVVVDARDGPFSAWAWAWRVVVVSQGAWAWRVVVVSQGAGFGGFWVILGMVPEAVEGKCVTSQLRFF